MDLNMVSIGRIVSRRARSRSCCSSSFFFVAENALHTSLDDVPLPKLANHTLVSSDSKTEKDHFLWPQYTTVATEGKKDPNDRLVRVQYVLQNQ